MTSSVSIEIQNIFAQNQLDDLKRFMAKRQRLNAVTTYMMYGFHLFQSAGVLVTTIGTGYNRRDIVWIGVGLNVFSSLINIFEKINVSVSTKLMKDITAIRAGTYVDEGTIVNDVKKDSDSKNSADSVD